MSDDDRVWRACLECGFRSQFAFYAPSSVYCEGCDAKIGETDRPVNSGLAALVDDEIIHPASGDTLATVEFDTTQVEIHESVAIGTDGRGERVGVYGVDPDLLPEDENDGQS